MFSYAPIQHIEIRDGQARIAGRSLKVKMVISRLIHGTGASVDEVIEQYNLTQAQVYAVMAYYFDHKETIDRDFEQEERIIQEHVPPLSDLLSRLNQQSQNDDG